MTDTGDRARVRRLKYWILVLTLAPGIALAGAGLTRAAAGYAVGGAVVLLNLLGTERSVLAFVDSSGGSRLLGFILYFGKLAFTAAVVALVLIRDLVPPMALMLGITTLLMALVFDILIFPRNKRDAEETEEP